MLGFDIATQNRRARAFRLLNPFADQTPPTKGFRDPANALCCARGVMTTVVVFAPRWRALPQSMPICSAGGWLRDLGSLVEAPRAAIVPFLFFFGRLADAHSQSDNRFGV